MSNKIQEKLDFDLDDLEELELNLSNELLEGFEDLSFLEAERALIGNSESFVETIGKEILEKFHSQFNLEQTDETLIDSNARKRYNNVEAENEGKVQDHEKIVDERTGRVTYKKKGTAKKKQPKSKKVKNLLRGEKILKKNNLREN